MQDEELLRYSRQIMVPQIDIEGQQRLAQSHALIIGAGGLGSPVAIYLAAAGVGTLTIADDDRVELSNLQRQILFSTENIGESKVAAASNRLNKLNPGIAIITMAMRLADAALARQVEAADVVIDCSDNFPTRFALNAACIAAGKPLVSGAAIRCEGQVSLFWAAEGGPCYQCLFDPAAQGSEESCSETGVFTPLVGVIGSLQAAEAMKVMLGLKGTLLGRVITYDLELARFRELRLRPDPNCLVCGPHRR
jgi:adenylyltransferase/sulfurtransferase